MNTPLVALSPESLRAAFASFPTGITAVAAMVDGSPAGLTASSFVSVSLDPPLVSVCVARTSTTWPVLRGIPRLGVSVLSEEHGQVARALAARGGDRFAQVSWEQASAGAVFVRQAALWLECSLYQEIPAGDHDIILLRIEEVWAYPAVPPLVFHGSQFRRLAVTTTWAEDLLDDL
jgi:flavin reductase (DIM6/NTAB) family NADH-FMN oxidoreductase RutF